MLLGMPCRAKNMELTILVSLIVRHFFSCDGLVEVGNSQILVAFIQSLVIKISSMVGLEGYCHEELVISYNHLLLPHNSIRRRLSQQIIRLFSFVEKIKDSLLESTSRKDHQDLSVDIEQQASGQEGNKLESTKRFGFMK